MQIINLYSNQKKKKKKKTSKHTQSACLEASIILTA